MMIMMAVIAVCTAKHSSMEDDTQVVSTSSIFTRRAETPKYSTMKDEEIEALFEDFKVEYGKVVSIGDKF